MTKICVLFQGYDPDLKLHEDDIIAIQSLYNRNRRTIPIYYHY